MKQQKQLASMYEFMPGDITNYVFMACGPYHTINGMAGGEPRVVVSGPHGQVVLGMRHLQGMLANFVRALNKHKDKYAGDHFHLLDLIEDSDGELSHLNYVRGRLHRANAYETMLYVLVASCHLAYGDMAPIERCVRYMNNNLLDEFVDELFELHTNLTIDLADLTGK